MNNPIKVRTTTPNEAIIDALYRAVIGLDTNDLPLFRSAFLNDDDVVFEMDGQVMKGFNVIHDAMFTMIGPMDTTHYINNARVQFTEGEKTAVVTATALAQHYKAGEGSDPATKRLLSGSRYQVDVVQDETHGLWKIKTWVMKIVWLEGDRSVMGGS